MKHIIESMNGVLTVDYKVDHNFEELLGAIAEKTIMQSAKYAYMMQNYYT